MHSNVIVIGDAMMRSHRVHRYGYGCDPSPHKKAVAVQKENTL